MATYNYKNFRVAAPAADTTSYATLLNCPSATQQVVSSIRVTNTTASNGLVRYAVMGSAGTPSVATGDFLAYDVTAWANDSFTDTNGIVLTAGQYLRVSAGATGVNFFVSYMEIA
jgi:hypothetical protein